jgi:hypothetical protein
MHGGGYQQGSWKPGRRIRWALELLDMALWNGINSYWHSVMPSSTSLVAACCCSDFSACDTTDTDWQGIVITIAIIVSTANRKNNKAIRRALHSTPSDVTDT